MEWKSAICIWLSSTIFAVLHSVMAAQFCKRWFYQHAIREPEYRLIYSVTAIVTTGVWIFYVHQLPDAPLYQVGGIYRILLWTLQVLGLWIVLAAFQPIDGLAFLGLRQSRMGIDPFIVHGIYRWLRHPMYAGTMLILLSMPEQTYNGLHFTLAICAYFITGSHFEESRMLHEHPDYADYRCHVPAFIPIRLHLASKPEA